MTGQYKQKSINKVYWSRSCAFDLSSKRLESKKLWSRYEKFSFVLFAWLWGAMIIFTAVLHFYSYNLTTSTSSTSGTHQSFHEIK